MAPSVVADVPVRALCPTISGSQTYSTAVIVAQSTAPWYA
jgi:hypothetical protein